MAPPDYESPWSKQVLPAGGEYARPGGSDYASHRESGYYHPDYAYYPAYYFAQRHHHHQPPNQDWTQPN